MRCPLAIEPQDSNHELTPTSANAQTASCFKGLVDHSQLMQCLRPTKPRPMAYYLGAYHVWHHKTPLRPQATKTEEAREVHLRCCCRALAQLLRIRQESPTYKSASRKLTNDMESEAVKTFQEWLECLSEAYDAETFLPSWIDAYDIRNVRTAMASVCHSDNLHMVPGIMARCDALLGRLVDRFPSTKVLRT